MKNHLVGKVAVVTGAAKGIGAGIARALAAEGASVVVNYASSKNAANDVVTEIKRNGGKAVAIQGDVSKREDVIRLFEETKKTFGSADILVNNAGRYEFGTIDAVTEESLEKYFRINVFGAIYATQEYLKHFGSKDGSIINIGSIVGANPGAGMVTYAATKGAVDTITRALSRELGAKGIRVNSVNPGPTRSDGTSEFFENDDVVKTILGGTPLGRLGEPEDIARAVVFLASDDARWVTGEILRVSGGCQGVG
jgi:3-oxoacyl-[acyl-carrier protein] reductase